MQITLAQIAVKLFAHSVNHRGVGLQQHADAHAVGEHASDLGTVLRAAGFLFHDAGQDQCLVGGFQRRIGLALGPSGLEPAVHGVQRAAQHGHVAAALGIGIGVREEAPLGVHAGAVQRGHQLFVGHGGRVLAQRIRLGERRAHLLEGPALHHGHGAQGRFAACQFLQQLVRCCADWDFVITGLDLAVLSRHAEPVIQQPRIRLDARLHRRNGHSPRSGSGFDFQLKRGICRGTRAQGQRGVQPPIGSTSRRERNQHQQNQ